MTVPSVSCDETYGWLGQFPQLREWIGPRHVHNLKAHGFKITNRKFESTLSIDRDDLSDDRLGIFKPALSEMGHLARQHPEELIFGLLAAGFSTNCFDGQNFFDTNHPLTAKDGSLNLVSNMQAGAGPGWYLLDTSRAVRPIVPCPAVVCKANCERGQEREKYDFQSKTDPTDDYVFMHDKYLYGVRARGCLSGLPLAKCRFWSLATGLWQQC